MNDFNLTLINVLLAIVQIRVISSTDSSDPTVTIDCGKLKGKSIHIKNSNIVCDAYIGIPFAQPPTGSLRWKKPQPPTCWQGTKEVKKFAPPCVQIMNDGTNSTGDSEDCLYLNIFIPKSANSSNPPLPVMVFFHGGAFEFGSAQEYDPEGICKNLASRGVIVVTTQYRLFMYGFYSTGDKAALGNYGIWDQIESLKWVKKNIAAFGGDPNKVTIFGESAGGASVSYITYAPIAEDLFHQSITESGSALTFWASPSDISVKTAKKLAKAANCSNSDSVTFTDCLRQLPTNKLQQVYNSLNLSADPDLNYLLWSVRFDGDLYNRSTSLVELHNGKPAIIGVNSLEVPGDVTNIPVANAVFDNSLNDTFAGNNSLENEILKQIARYVYIDSKGDRNNNTFVAQQLAKFLTDLQYHNAAAQEATAKAKAGSPVWVYNFDFYSDNVFQHDYPFEKGAPHAHELCYLFLLYIPEDANQLLICPEKYDGKYRKIADYLGEMWTNFAIKGDPSPQGIKWPRFHNVTNANTMHIRSNLTIEPQFFADVENFWNYLKPNIEHVFGGKK